MVHSFLNLPLMYLIRLERLRSSSLLCILRICVVDGTFPASSRALSILVRYSMLKASVCFFNTFLPEYADHIPVVSYVSSALGVNCGNWRCIWVSC